MTNQHNNLLYTGVTNNLVRRIAEHKAKVNKGFTYKYNCDKLVYFESLSSITDAIRREKQLKNWKREWKKLKKQIQSKHFSICKHLRRRGANWPEWVNANLTSINERIKTYTDKHNEFLKEAGLKRI